MVSSSAHRSRIGPCHNVQPQTDVAGLFYAHSKTIISNLVDFFRRVQLWKSKVKIRTRALSNRRPKMAIELMYVTNAAAGVTSLVPGINNSRPRNDLTHIRFVTALQVESVTSLHDCKVASIYIATGGACRFFVVCLNVFPLGFWPRTFAIQWILWKAVYQIRDCGFGLHLPFKPCMNSRLFSVHPLPFVSLTTWPGSWNM